MRLRMVSTAIAGTAFAVVVGCGGLITDGTEAAWREKHSAALLPGYTEFKGLGIDADVGVAIFSYQLPPNVGGADAAALVARQIAQGSCYRPVAASGLEQQLRCASNQDAAFQEYRIRSNPATRRVTIMYGGFDSKSEIDRYERFASMFLRHAESQ